MANLDITSRIYAPRKDGDTVFLKAGVYSVSEKAKNFVASLPSNISLIGERGTIIEMDGDGAILSAVNKTRIRIENIEFRYKQLDGPKPFASAIDLRGCDGVEIRNCIISNCGASAIRAARNAGSDAYGRIFDSIGEGFGPTRNLVIADCNFNNCIGPVIGFKPGGAQNVEIRNNIFNGFGTYAISAEGEGQPQGWTSNIFITDNAIINGSIKLRKADYGVLFGIYVGENAYNIFIRRNYLSLIGEQTATFCGAIAVSTSPSQGDTKTSDIEISDNIIDHVYGGQSGGILLMPGNKSISGVDIFRNIIGPNCKNNILGCYPDPLKNKGKVKYLRYDEKVKVNLNGVST
jgi:polygalacturonase